MDKFKTRNTFENFENFENFSLFFSYFQRGKAGKNGKLGENGREGMKRGGSEWEKMGEMKWRGKIKNLDWKDWKGEIFFSSSMYGLWKCGWGGGWGEGRKGK